MDWSLIAVVVCAVAASAICGWLLGRSRGERHPRENRPGTELGEQTRALLGSLNQLVVVLDAADRVVFASPQAREHAYARDKELPDDVLRDLVRRSRSASVVVDEEVTVVRSVLAGGGAVVGARAFPMPPAFTVLLLEDRSRARRVEEVRRDFVANVSHELKTPIGGLSLLAEAIHDAEGDGEAVAHFARRMQREADRLARLVQEIVDFSRVQVSEQISEPERVDIATIVNAAVDHVRVMAEGKRIAIRFAGMAFGTTASVLGDEHQLIMALRNLLLNAVAYSEEGGKVVVQVTHQRNERVVDLAVIDQGIGIPSDELERIFERFYRVDAARSRQTGGSGLGLAIVKHVVSNHGGWVTVWSRVGIGSTFTITLPVVK